MDTPPTHRRPSRAPIRTTLDLTPIATIDAESFGWTRAAQRHAVAAGDLQRPRRGVLRAAPTSAVAARWEHDRLELVAAARAAAVSSPRAVISHRAAAAHLGLPLLGRGTRPCLTVPAGTALRRVAHAHLHRATLGPDDVVVVDEVAVTSPARTVTDMAREFGVDAGVVAGDVALRTGLATPEDLFAAYAQCRGWPGRRAARITVLSLDPRAESPLESLSRLRLRSAGIAGAEPQVRIHDADGRFLGRCDFYLDEFGVVGEADGDLKYADAAAITAERARHEQFEQTGLIVARWGWGALADFGPTAARISRACARGARPNSPLRRWRAIPTSHTPLCLPDGC